MAINKVIYGASTLIDLTNDTVTAQMLLAGATAHDKSGSLITGTALGSEARGMYVGSDTGAQPGDLLVADDALVPGNITNSVELFGVTGSYTGSSGMNVQGYAGEASVTSTTYTATEVRLTVAKSGTYKVSWIGYRNTTSGTSGSQLYIDGTAYGSAQTTFTNTYGQSVVLDNVVLTQGQEIAVYARARSSSYRMGVGNLLIEQTA